MGGGGAMGQHHNIRSFFLKADVHYLAGKLAPGMPAEIDADNDDALIAAIQKKILKDRRKDDITRSTARELWDLSVKYSRRWDGDGLLFEVLGDEYWYETPQVKNPEYEYLCDIISAVKAAFKQLTEEKQT